MLPRYSAQLWTGSTRLYNRRVSWPAQEVSEGVIPLQKFGMLPYRSSVGVSCPLQESSEGVMPIYRSPVHEGVMPITGVQ